jgi:mannose-6-phosphate isomerase-like protein (cupin superfamily)
MFKKHPRIRRDDFVSYYGNRESIPLRINVIKFEAEGLADWDPLHYHKTSTQFFIVLEGALSVEVDGNKIEVDQNTVLEIKPNTKYRVRAITKAPASYVCVGTKNLEGDRVVVG